MAPLRPQRDRYSKMKRGASSARFCRICLGDSGASNPAASHTYAPLELEGTQNGLVKRGLILPTLHCGEHATRRFHRRHLAISPGPCFDTFGLMISGEDFRPGIPARRIAIVNKSAGRQGIPRQNPVAARFRIPEATSGSRGVAMRNRAPSAEEPIPVFSCPIERGNARPKRTLTHRR